MLGLFAPKKPKRVKIPPDGSMTTFQNVWEKKRMPSPGAQAYAFESLGLVQFTPIGPSVNVRQGIVPVPGAPQPVSGLAVPLNGIPTTAGQIMGQQLYDPAVGYAQSIMPIYNSPFPYSNEPPAGQII